MARPFILTAALPADIQGWSDRLRRTHYPAERNHLHAHVTMFHSFAPSLLDELKDYLPTLTREFAPLDAAITGLLDLGTGTASSGDDYTANSGTLTFAIGQTTKTILVDVTPEDLVELDETLHVNLSNLVNNGRAISITDGQGEGTITNAANNWQRIRSIAVGDL